MEYQNGPRAWRLTSVLAGILTLAFLIRLGVRLASGESDFWNNSYFLYYALAQNFVLGNGFCSDNHNPCVEPLYPLFLTVSVFFGKNWLLVVVPQALLGAGTALCAFLIGRLIFNATVGILACGIATFYPYYVVHDTALQYTSMFTFCTAVAVWLLLRGSKLDRDRDWLLAGVALGTLPLIRTTGAPVVGVGLLWCIWNAQSSYLEAVRKGFIMLAAVGMVTGPWLVRTYHTTGTPEFTSQTGMMLWIANNAQTFSQYPSGSIDRSLDEAWQKLPESDHMELERLAENGRSDWFAQRALSYVRDNPSLVLRGMFTKLDAAFSWRLNPYRQPLAEAAYAIGYVPVAFLGLIGMFLAIRKREVMLIGMLYFAFICVTVVFWAHTSHRSYLDVYWMVFAASVMAKVWLVLAPSSYGWVSALSNKG